MINKTISHYSTCLLSELFEELETGSDGLSTGKAQLNLESYGHNSFEITKKIQLLSNGYRHS